MWNIKEIKNSAKEMLKNNLWTLLFLSMFMSITIAKYI